MTPFGVRQFRRLLAGCLAINCLMFLLQMMGGVLAGHFLGEEALAGVSLASPLLSFSGFLFALIGGGIAINYSIRRGRLDRDGAESVFMQGLWMSLAFGGCLALCAWMFRDAYLSLMGADGAVARYAVGYWSWLPVGLFFMFFSNLVMSCCYCDGDTGYATLGIVTQFVVSLLVTWWLLTCVKGLGVAACSIGFASGYVFAFLVLSGHFFRRCNTFTFAWRFRLADTWTIIRTSAGDALGFLGDALIYIVLGAVLSRSFGPAALMVYPVFVLVKELGGYANGFASAMQPIVAVYAGERNHRSIRQICRYVFGRLALFSLAISLLLVICPQLALAAVAIDDPTVVPLAVQVVRLTAMMLVPLTVLNLLNNYFQLIERPLLAVGLTIFYWMVLPVLMMTVFANFGEFGFWCWAPVTRWCGLLLFAIFLLCRYGVRRFPLLLDREREAAIKTFDLVLDEMEIALNAEAVTKWLEDRGLRHETALRARLLVEESLMVIKDRNEGRRVFAEVTVDLNDGPLLTLRDDGIIFDITDADAKVNGLRTFLVATMMAHQSEKSNILTTGFNRNVFRLDCGPAKSV